MAILLAIPVLILVVIFCVALVRILFAAAKALILGLLAGLLFGTAAYAVASIAWADGSQDTAGTIGASLGFLVFLATTVGSFGRSMRTEGGLASAETENGTRQTEMTANAATASQPADFEPLPLERDRKLASVWDKLATQAGDSAPAVRRARASCARLLLIAEDGQTLDPGIADTAALIRRSIPELQASAEALIADLKGIERVAVFARTVSSLESIGVRAEADIARHREALNMRFETIEAHVVARTT